MPVATLVVATVVVRTAPSLILVADGVRVYVGKSGDKGGGTGMDPSLLNLEINAS